MKAVTFGIGKEYEKYCKLIKNRFQKLNDIEVIILNKYIKYKKKTDLFWVKTNIFDFINEDLIIWIDSDIVPIKPIRDDIEKFKGSNFDCAITFHDNSINGFTRDENQHQKRLSILKENFSFEVSSGLFYCKKSGIDIIEKWKKRKKDFDKLTKEEKLYVGDEPFLSSVINKNKWIYRLYQLGENIHTWDEFGTNIKNRWLYDKNLCMYHFPSSKKKYLDFCWKLV